MADAARWPRYEIYYLCLLAADCRKCLVPVAGTEDSKNSREVLAK